MEQTQASPLEIGISQLISSTFIHLDEGDRQLMKRFGITTTQYWALVHLEHPEGRSLSELARLLICDKSNITSVVDKLEEAHLAWRQRSGAGSDRRFTRVILTEQGQQLRRQAKEAREGILSTRLHLLGEENMQNLYHLLQQLSTLLGDQFARDEVSTLIERATKQPLERS